MRLGAAGNYAFKTEGTTVYAAFEADDDAKRFAELFKAGQITRESEWRKRTMPKVPWPAFRVQTQFGA